MKYILYIWNKLKGRKMEKPNYYAVITADVRYDNTLSSSEKLFYGEISALSSKTGECWASNSYFASLYDVSTSTISSWVKKLEKRNYITVQYQKEGKQIIKRIIKIGGQKSDNPIQSMINTYSENLNGYSENHNTPIQNIKGGWSENLKENNINSNIIKEEYQEDNNIKEYSGEMRILDKLLETLTQMENKKEWLIAANEIKEYGGIKKVYETMGFDKAVRKNYDRAIENAARILNL